MQYKSYHAIWTCNGKLGRWRSCWIYSFGRFWHQTRKRTKQTWPSSRTCSSSVPSTAHHKNKPRRNRCYPCSFYFQSAPFKAKVFKSYLNMGQTVTTVVSHYLKVNIVREVFRWMFLKVWEGSGANGSGSFTWRFIQGDAITGRPAEECRRLYASWWLLSWQLVLRPTYWASFY